MYLDAMQQIYGNVTKVIVESRQGSNLLYMPLDKIMQSAASAPGAALVEPASGASGASGSVVPQASSNSAPVDVRGVTVVVAVSAKFARRVL